MVITGPLAEWLKTALTVWKIWGTISRPVKLDAVSLTTRHRYDVSSQMYYLDAKMRR